MKEEEDGCWCCPPLIASILWIVSLFPLVIAAFWFLLGMLLGCTIVGIPCANQVWGLLFCRSETKFVDSSGAGFVTYREYQTLKRVHRSDCGFHSIHTVLQSWMPDLGPVWSGSRGGQLLRHLGLLAS